MNKTNNRSRKRSRKKANQTKPKKRTRTNVNTINISHKSHGMESSSLLYIEDIKIRKIIVISTCCDMLLLSFPLLFFLHSEDAPSIRYYYRVAMKYGMMSIQLVSA